MVNSQYNTRPVNRRASFKQIKTQIDNNQETLAYTANTSIVFARLLIIIDIDCLAITRRGSRNKMNSQNSHKFDTRLQNNYRQK